jgi:hypothetical protein
MFGERRPFDDAALTTIPEIWQLHALTVGAALRNPSLDVADDTAGGRDARDARQRMWELNVGLAAGTPPPDWKRWTSSALEVERYIHAGTAGVAWEPFYASLDAYMKRVHAPAQARQSIDFRHALAVWDFKAASALADSLAPAALRGESWAQVDEIREGGVVAKLKLGDAVGARRLWVMLSSAATRNSDALRSLLLDSYIIAAYEKTARH